MLTRQTSASLAFVALLAATTNGVAAADDPKADAIRHAMAQVEKSIVPVEFVIEITHGLRSQRTVGNTVGVVASDDGVIVVNGTIFNPSPSQRGGATISKPSDIEVVLPRRHRRLKAEYIGLDEDLVLAFLKIPIMKGTGLAPLKFDLDRAPAIAEEVLAVGRLPRSHDYAATFALARVSSIQRRPIPMFGTADDLRSMLGCPVVTMDGKAVGVLAQNNLLRLNQKKGLNLLSLNLRPGNAWILPGRTFAHLVKNPPKKRARKGWLGIEMQAMTVDIARALGLKIRGGIMVSRVFRGKGFAAEKAGLREEDIITHFDGRPVRVFRESELAIFRQMVRDAGPKSQISLKVIREGKPVDLALNLSETPKTRDEAKKVINRQFGLVVSEITFDAALMLGMGLETMGVIVDYVDRGSWASLGGLQPNDVIQRIDSKKITTISDFEKKIGEIEKEKQSDAIPILVLRRNETVFARIEPDWK